MPSIAQLEYILAVHRLGHFGRAAASVAISQPTLSAQIHKVEEEFGITLFDRRARPIRATELGRIFIEHAEVVVAAHQRLERLAAGGFTRIAGPLVLGIIPTLAPYVLPWFLRDFATKYPAVELTIQERPTDELVAAIKSSRIDAAILATPLDERGIAERVLLYDPFYLYAHPDEPILCAAEVDLTELDARKLWLLDDGHCVRAQVINFCGVEERVHLGSVRFAGGSFETIRHLIDASEGYTLIPETYARTLPRPLRARCVRAFADATPTREVGLVHHRLSWKGEIIDALEQSIARTMPRVFRGAKPEDEPLAIRVAPRAALSP